MCCPTASNAAHELKEHADDPKLTRRCAGLSKISATTSRMRTSDLLPKLRDACDEADFRELGKKFEQAKKMAPTRPHPSAPDKPPANKILGPGVGLIDRMRDA